MFDTGWVTSSKCVYKTFSTTWKWGTGKGNQSRVFQQVYKIKQAREKREKKGQYKSKGDARQRHGMQTKPLTKQYSLLSLGRSLQTTELPCQPHCTSPWGGLLKSKPFGKSKAKMTWQFSVLLIAPVGSVFAEWLPSCHPHCLLSSSSDAALVWSLVFTWAKLFCGQLSNNYQSLSLIKLCYYWHSLEPEK